MSRWPWPRPEHYAAAGMLFAGAALAARYSRVPAWAIGLYGIVGAVTFYPDWVTTRAVRFGVTEPGAIGVYATAWAVGLTLAWALCRAAAAMLRR